MKRNKTMYLLMLGYGFVAALIATIVYGADTDIYIGLFFGIGSLMVNYWLLSYAIEAITTQKMTFSIFPIGLGRFLIFGAAGCFCFTQSHLCVVFFTFAILVMPASALLLTLWEARDDSY